MAALFQQGGASVRADIARTASDQHAVFHVAYPLNGVAGQRCGGAVKQWRAAGWPVVRWPSAHLGHQLVEPGPGLGAFEAHFQRHAEDAVAIR
ncbi:hypothetical protein SDC9_121094 [bioreactor metagenome]|uniref:Uncharacterized protein n=1 Tax=bioreactor metagenome TaxID=1076179 RepID=A0A645CAZ8_9ZZZZ